MFFLNMGKPSLMRKRFLIWLSLVIILLSTLLLLYICSPSEKALEMSCYNNLKRIYVALNSYYSDYKLYPSSLDVLVKKRYVSGDALKCPLANFQTTLYYFYTYKNIRNETDYEYTTPEIEKMRAVVCYDKLGNHAKKNIPQTINVLFMDNWIERYPESNWEQLASQYSQTIDK